MRITELGGSLDLLAVRWVRLSAVLAFLLAPGQLGSAQGAWVSPYPAERDGYKFFDAKLKKESGGRIQIQDFAFRRTNTEVSNAVPYWLVLNFKEACSWRFGTGDKTLSFETQPLPARDHDSVTNEPGTLLIPKRGWGVSLFGDILFDRTPQGWVATGFVVSAPPAQADIRDLGGVRCISNLRQISLSLFDWAREHHDQFIFNVSTNQGGTRELRNPEADGFDRNAAAHFRELNDLNPRLLICPGDDREPAADLQSLSATNVSYQLRAASNGVPGKPGEVLLRCPTHHRAVFCDGSLGNSK
jgi:hypothetical protein